MKKHLTLSFVLICSFQMFSQDVFMLANEKITKNICSGYVYDDGGASDNYLDNSNSTITLVSKEKGKKLKLTLENLDMPYEQYLAFYKGGSVDPNKKIGDFSSLYGSNVFFYGDSITIALNATSSSAGGFKIKSECIVELPKYDFQVKPLFPKPMIHGDNNLAYHISSLPINQTAMSPLNLQYYLSKDTIYSKNDIFLKDYIAFGYDNYGISINDNVYVSDEIPSGKYFLLILVDPRKVISETNEKNNTVVIPTEVK